MHVNLMRTIYRFLICVVLATFSAQPLGGWPALQSLIYEQNLSWITEEDLSQASTVALGVSLMSYLVVGPLYDAAGPANAGLIGCTLSGVGMFLTALALATKANYLCYFSLTLVDVGSMLTSIFCFGFMFHWDAKYTQAIVGVSNLTYLLGALFSNVVVYLARSTSATSSFALAGGFLLAVGLAVRYFAPTRAENLREAAKAGAVSAEQSLSGLAVFRQCFRSLREAAVEIGAGPRRLQNFFAISAFGIGLLGVSTFFFAGLQPLSADCCSKDADAIDAAYTYIMAFFGGFSVVFFGHLSDRFGFKLVTFLTMSFLLIFAVLNLLPVLSPTTFQFSTGWLYALIVVDVLLYALLSNFPPNYATVNLSTHLVGSSYGIIFAWLGLLIVAVSFSVEKIGQQQHWPVAQVYSKSSGWCAAVSCVLYIVFLCIGNFDQLPVNSSGHQDSSSEGKKSINQGSRSKPVKKRVSPDAEPLLYKK